MTNAYLTNGRLKSYVAWQASKPLYENLNTKNSLPRKTIESSENEDRIYMVIVTIKLNLHRLTEDKEFEYFLSKNNFIVK